MCAGNVIESVGRIFGKVRLSFSFDAEAFYGLKTIFMFKSVCADDYQSILRFASEKKFFRRCAHIKVSVNIDGAI